MTEQKNACKTRLDADRHWYPKTNIIEAEWHQIRELELRA